MFHQTGIARRLVGLIALLMIFLMHAPVQGQVDTDSIAKCITDEWEEYEGCLADLPWWAELLCAARFTAEVVLCTPKMVLDGVK